MAGYIEKIDLKLLRMGWKSAVGEIDEVGEIEVVFSELVKQLRKVE
jgi:Holliday junction resolvase-like predicted endonuclease